MHNLMLLITPFSIFNLSDIGSLCLVCMVVIFTFIYIEGPSWPWSCGSWIYICLCIQCLSPLMLWVRISTRERCTTLCYKVCQWLATGRWFSPGPPVSSTNKTDQHDITEISLKDAVSTIKPNQSKPFTYTNTLSSPLNQNNIHVQIYAELIYIL